MSITFDRQSGEVEGDSRYLMAIDDGSQKKRRSQSLVWGIGAAALCLVLLLLTFILVANNTSAIGSWDTKYENLIYNLTKSKGAPSYKSEALRDQPDQRNIYLSNLTKDRDNLRDEHEALRVEREALRNERSALKDERVALKDERDQLKIYFSNLTRYGDALRDEREALRDEREALRDERGALKDDRDQLTNQSSNLTKDRDILRDEREALRDERGALKVERESLKDERGALKGEQDHLKSLILNLTKDRDTLKDERDVLRDERDKLKINSSNLTEEVAALQNQYNAVVESRDKLLEEIDSLKINQTAKTCFQGWAKFNNKCYYYSRKGLSESWDASRQDCKTRGGDLAIPTTKAELTFVSRGNGITWIGLSDKLQEGKWQWVDGTDLEGETFWKPGEPNNHGSNEDCVEVSRDEVKWNDAPCTNKFSWVCEA